MEEVIRTKRRLLVPTGVLVACVVVGFVSLYRPSHDIPRLPHIEERGDQFHQPDARLMSSEDAQGEHVMPNKPPDPSNAEQPGLSEKPDERVLDLPGGIRVAETVTEGSGLVPHDIVTYTVISVEAGSNWDFVGLKVGDSIASANRQGFRQFNEQERLEILSDPDAELNITLQQPGGGFYTTYVSLNRALEEGLPSPAGPSPEAQAILEAWDSEAEQTD